MKRKKIIFILIGLITIGMTACNDIFEKNIEDSLVNLLSPTDSAHTQNATITFWWDEVKYANKYNLQIVTPNFWARSN